MVRFSFCEVHSASCVDKVWDDSKGGDGQTNWKLIRIPEARFSGVLGEWADS